MFLRISYNVFIYYSTIFLSPSIESQIKKPFKKFVSRALVVDWTVPVMQSGVVLVTKLDTAEAANREAERLVDIGQN